VLRDEFFEFIPKSLFEVEARARVLVWQMGGSWRLMSMRRWSNYRTRRVRLNKTEPVRHLERSRSQRSGGAACDVGVEEDV